MNILQFPVRLVAKRVHRLEYDSVAQFKFHFFFTWFWFTSMVLVGIFVPRKSTADLVSLGILEVSLWANFVSHFTALGTAINGIYSSGRANEVPGLAKYDEGSLKHLADRIDTIADIKEEIVDSRPQFEH